MLARATSKNTEKKKKGKRASGRREAMVLQQSRCSRAAVAGRVVGRRRSRDLGVLQAVHAVSGSGSREGFEIFRMRRETDEEEEEEEEEARCGCDRSDGASPRGRKREKNKN